MVHSLVRISLALGVVYLAYAALMFVFQRSMLFPVPGARGAVAADDPPRGVRRAWLQTSVGRVEAWLVPGPVAQRGPALLFAHGNAEHIDGWPELLPGVTALGASLLLVEYPGYGRSDGTPSEATIGEAMIAAYDWLREQPEVDPARIVGFGRSLGAGAVCTLIGQRALAALVLQSGFTSVRAFATARLLPGFLVRDPFDNVAAIARYAGPTLVIHGDRDDVIPYAHGQRLAASARRGQLVTYACAHNDCPPDYSVMWRDVHAFLATHGVLGE